ncbi:MAG TPA: T9SS type A sorting domain-containing protein, partial [Chitinophagaceae bacterium]|nr:T9SS type A sorting domain-containing protein [Chitinophagaceae bacterium]
TESTLPLLLERFDATLNGSKVDLSWTTSQEREVSHFTIERSTNGVDYKEVGLVFAADNAALHTNYDFKDPINTITSGVLYYRLRMVDTDGKYQYSPVRLIRVGGDVAQVKLLTYPNPVTAELRVTLPNEWQSKEVVFEIYSAGGQLVKHIVNNRAGQTEVINMQDMHAGIYLVKVSNGNASAVQRIVKTK